MSVRNPLTGVPLRAARWSATHPWRAILAWLVFVLVAVGLAVAVPTQEPTDADYRLGESGRADAMVDAAGLDGAHDRERADHPARRRRARPGRGEPRPQPRSAPACGDLEGVETVSGAAVEPGPLGPADRGPARPGPGGRRGTAGRDRARPGGAPGAADPAGGRHRRSMTSIDERVADDLVRRRGDQPAGHPGPDAAGVRRADRGRDPGAARGDQRGRHDRDHRAAVAPGATPREPSAA